MDCLPIFALLVVLALFPRPSESTFTDPFRQFLTALYGQSTSDSLSRLDLGPLGSFGGGSNEHTPGNRTRLRPVVFIHGLGTIASDYEDVRHYFLTHGYCDSEFYATSYGKGALTLATDAVFCQYVKSQRLLIAAVAAYTNNEVDIIGFSMGSPMGRKAILGGNCVDTGEDLGDPLTNYVHTFIGVAGANFGAAYLCHVVVPAPLFHVCNSNNGISCHSDLLNELNSQGYTYEGRLVYTLYSEDDEVVGYKVCGGTVLATAIPGETKAFGFGPLRLLDHFGVMHLTVDLQVNLTTADQDL